MTNPQTIAKYEIIEKLGQGGFGTVYRARDAQMGREVALKVIGGNLAQETDFVQRFRQEASSAANLYHPNIVTVYDFGDADGQLYLAMRLIQGPTLAQLLAEEGRLPLAEALPILEQLAGALDYLHRQGLVHRDLKPANVMLEGAAPHFQTTLTDFGLVRSLEASTYLTQDGGTLGTPAYMAPEQAAPEKWGEITSLTDVYALGVLVYEMLLGRPPFEGELAAVLHAQAYEEPVIPLELVPEMGDDLVAVLLKALAKPPAERYPRAGALVEAFKQIAAERERRAAEQVELVQLLEQARAAGQAGDWLAMQTYSVQAMQIDRTHPEALKMMAEATTGLQREYADEAARRERARLYGEGEQALDAGKWEAAIQAFEAVAAENPDFRDVQDRLAQARDELQRAQWYDEAIAHAKAERWAEACRAWLGVLAGRPDYHDGDAATRLLVAVAGLLAQFQGQQHELDQARAALPLYAQLAAALYRQAWPDVVPLAEQLLALALDAPWSPDWLEDARQKLAAAEAVAEGFAAAAAGDDTRVWEKDGKEMVRVPAGEFLYGDKKQKKTLPEFWIDKTPVTNAEYKRFIDANSERPAPFVDEGWAKPYNWDRQSRSFPPDKADHPVVLVSWHDAAAYAEWTGKRLPTEEEWEKAARGADGRKYPWGDWGEGRCNSKEAGVGGTTPVGQYSPDGDSPYGCVDMSGNVWEWTATDYDRSNKVLRGGGWNFDVENVRAANRLDLTPGNRYGHFGFRCVVKPVL